MKKIIIVLLCLTLVCSSVGFSTAVTNNTIYVDDDGTADYTSIQDAINMAKNGDTIYVYDGVYRETILIYKSLHLIGESKDNTIINGTNIASFSTISIISPAVKIEDFSIIDTDFTTYGNTLNRVDVLSIKASNCTIKNNDIISNTRFGIHVYLDGDNTHILENYITALTAGINLDSASHNMVMGNWIVGGKGVHKDNCVQLNGIQTDHSDYNTFTLNHLEGNAYGLSLHYSNYNQFTKNNFINGGTTKKVGNTIITICSSNVYSYLLNRNYWENNYWDNYYGLLPFHSVTDHIFPWTIEDFLNIDWEPASQPYTVGEE